MGRGIWHLRAVSFLLLVFKEISGGTVMCAGPLCHSKISAVMLHICSVFWWVFFYPVDVVVGFSLGAPES